jgi:cytochrome c-type biogenesis protein CcmH
VRRAALTFAFALLATTALAEPAAAPDRPLTSPSQEARAQTLFQDIRCVVCQHESIADSPAEIAADMRRLVREEIASGSSDQAIRADLVRRWGDYILFKPPVNIATLLLWFGPLLLVLLAGGAFIALSFRGKPVETPLSPDEERRLAELVHPDPLRPYPDATSSHD